MPGFSPQRKSRAIFSSPRAHSWSGPAWNSIRQYKITILCFSEIRDSV